MSARTVDWTVPPAPGTGAPEAGGLRERKKRLMRQQLSDTATEMFMERGFGAVRVAEVAEACGVSEKTVFNYFPTKESLILDRLDVTVASLRTRRASEQDGLQLLPHQGVADPGPPGRHRGLAADRAGRSRGLAGRGGAADPGPRTRRYDVLARCPGRPRPGRRRDPALRHLDPGHALTAGLPERHDGSVHRGGRRDPGRAGRDE